jgi:hypothetical protein
MVGMKKKRSFLIEGEVQSPALSNGVYLKFIKVLFGVVPAL